MADANIELKLKDVRLSFPHLFSPQENTNDNGDKSYSFGCTLLLDKVGHADQIDALKAAVRQAIKAKWPGVKKHISPDKLCLRDGEYEDEETGEKEGRYDGYAGCMFLSCRRPAKLRDGQKPSDLKSPIQVIGPRKGKDGKFPRLSEDEVYAGCYVNAIVRIYAYDGSKGDNPDRVNATIEVVQFKRHGEAFGASSVDADNAMDEDEDAEEVGGGDNGSIDEPAGDDPFA